MRFQESEEISSRSGLSPCHPGPSIAGSRKTLSADLFRQSSGRPASAGFCCLDQTELPPLRTSAVAALGRKAGSGLVSYGIGQKDQFPGAAAYVDRILRGASPADLPVQLPTKFEPFVNLKTARALGITIPQSILARADEAIQQGDHRLTERSVIRPRTGAAIQSCWTSPLRTQGSARALP
jgi:hypothetical protein